MNLDKKRWIILAAACLINLCLGSIYAWSVFASSMAEHFSNALGQNVTSGDLAIVYTIARSPDVTFCPRALLKCSAMEEANTLHA